MIVKETWMNLIASGGISSLDDIRKVRETGACGYWQAAPCMTARSLCKDAMKAAK